jgi:hypothetical protein
MHTLTAYEAKIPKPRTRKPKIRRPKIHFEQVPLATVRKIVKERLEREIYYPDEIDDKTPENGLDEPSPAAVSFGPIKL